MHLSLFALLASIAFAFRAISFQVIDNYGRVGEKKDICHLNPVTLKYNGGEIILSGHTAQLNRNMVDSYHTNTTEDKKNFAVYTIHDEVHWDSEEMKFKNKIFTDEESMIKFFQSERGKHVIVERILGDNPAKAEAKTFEI